MQVKLWVHDNPCPTLTLRNTPTPRSWRAGIMLALLVAATLLATPPHLLAQNEAPTLTAPRVDRSHALRVHSLIEEWVREGAVPQPNAEAANALPRLNVSGVEGMRITLRWAGEQTMGIGDVYGPEVPRTDDAVDLIELARNATSRALQQVHDRAEASLLRARQAGREAEHQEIFRRTLQGLLVDIQIALVAEPVKVPLNDPDAALQMFASGYHGLVMSLPDVPVAGVVWPASALASNVTPHGQILQLLSQAQLTPDDAKTIGQPRGPALSRFRVLHLVRPGLDQPPQVLTRGNVLIRPDDFDVPTLDAMAERLAANLARRLGETGPAIAGEADRPPMRGTFLPTTGHHEPETASTEELALTSYALARRVRLLSTLEPNSPAYRNAVEASRTATHQLEQAVVRAQLNVTPHSTALLMMTIIESPHLADRKQLRDRLAARLMRLQNDDGTFRLSPAADARTLNTAAQGLMFAAMATLFEQTRDATVGEVTGLAQAAAWRMVAEDQATSALPWLMIGEGKLRGLEGVVTPPDAPTREDRIAIIQALAKIMFERQVTSTTPITPDDVLGGFDFSEQLSVPGGTAPAPDWRTAEVLTFLARCIADPDIVPPAERSAWVLRSSLAGRFIAQLMFDEPSCFYVPSRRDAIGGVRQAMDDNRLQVAATALSLIAATELQQTFNQLSQTPPR